MTLGGSWLKFRARPLTCVMLCIIAGRTRVGKGGQPFQPPTHARTQLARPPQAAKRNRTQQACTKSHTSFVLWRSFPDLVVPYGLQDGLTCTLGTNIIHTTHTPAERLFTRAQC